MRKSSVPTVKAKGGQLPAVVEQQMSHAAEEEKSADELHKALDAGRDRRLLGSLDEIVGAPGGGLVVVIVPDNRGQARENVVRALFERAEMIIEWNYGQFHVVKRRAQTPPTPNPKRRPAKKGRP